MGKVWRRVVCQRKTEVLSPEEGRWMLGMEKYIFLPWKPIIVQRWFDIFFLKLLASQPGKYMFWRPREMPNVTSGWRRIYDKNNPSRAGCLSQTQQMKPSLTACSLGWTSNSLALGEEKLHRQPPFLPWHAEPQRKLFNLSQQWFPSYKNRMTILTHSGLQTELERESRIYNKDFPGCGLDSSLKMQC